MSNQEGRCSCKREPGEVCPEYRTKEPNKDFRTRLLDILDRSDSEGYSVSADKILALCKEMLVPEPPAGREGSYWIEGWNAAVQEILSKINGEG